MSRAWWALMMLGCATSSSPEPVTAPPGPGPEVAVALRLTEAAPGPGGMPRTDAALALIFEEGRREVRPLERLDGVCTHEAAPDALLQVRCWWAGAGTLLRLTRDADALLVTRVPLDEMSGPGAPTLIERVELPPRARLRLIGP